VRLLEFLLGPDLLGDVVLDGEVVDDPSLPVVKRADGEAAVEETPVFAVIAQAPV
jgi:hypothetical protein